MKIAIEPRLRRLSWALGAAAVLLIPTVPRAGGVTSWHVRSDGSNNTCDGLHDAADSGSGPLPRPCAFRAPQKAVDAAAPGDTILVHAGTYGSPGDSVVGLTTIVGFDNRGEFDSEDHRLTLKGAGDGAVVFDGGNSIDTGIVIWGTSFLTIEGIEMKRFTADVSASFTYGAAGVNVGSPGPTSPSSSLVLRSLVVRDATNAHPDGSFSEIAISCEDCTDNLIDACLIESVEPVAIALGSDSSVAIDQSGEIRDTTILHVRDLHRWLGISGSRINDWVVDGVYIAETAEPHAETELIRVRNSKRWDVMNSVFFRPPRTAISFIDDVLDTNLSEQHFVLNDTIDCTGSAGDGIRLDRINGAQVRNNIIANCDAAVRMTGDLSGTELGFNDLFNNGVDYQGTGIVFDFTLVGGDIPTDPRFVGVAPRPDPFYRLAPGSNAIDAGNDSFCAVEPDDEECDMGAFQSSNAPETPSIVGVDMITGRSAVLRGSPFSDPDAGDVHTASRWQVDVLKGDFSDPVHDSGRTTADLRSHRVGGLDASTTYKSRVRYEDAEGNVSEWSDPSVDTGDEFTTLVATALPPRVIDVDPAARTVDVPVTTTVTLTFNVPILASSVTTSTVKLTADGFVVPQVGGSPSVQGDDTVVVTPAILLNPDTTYVVVVVEGGVTSRDGAVPGRAFRSTFTTQGALASSNPANGATGVSVGVSPQLVFNWSVNAATANTSTVVLKDVTSGKKVTLASVTAVGTTVTIVPAAPLKPNHKHQVVVKSGASGLKFADGRELGKNVKVSFKTGAAP